jgi:hypothetical protein
MSITLYIYSGKGTREWQKWPREEKKKGKKKQNEKEKK